MTDRLPVPPDLQHLLENREADERRKKKRRASDTPPQNDLASATGESGSADDADAQTPGPERRSGAPRRQRNRRDE